MKKTKEEKISSRKSELKKNAKQKRRRHEKKGKWATKTNERGE